MRIEKRALGSTGFKVTVLGIGDLADRSVPLEKCVVNRIIMIPLKKLTFPQASPSTFELMDAEGQVHRVPFHRVREVYRNSQRIWHRPEPKTAETE